MGHDENYRVARALQDAFDSGDMAAMDRLIADDIVWHEIGRAEPRRGKAEVRSGGVGGSDVDYAITASAHDILASDDHAVVMVDAHATRGGRTLDYRTCEVYHIHDGQVHERWAFSDDTAAITAFFA